MLAPIPTQTFIDALARMDNSPCDAHGDVIRCQPLRRALTCVYQVTFEDQTTARYAFRRGVPVQLQEKS